MKTSALIITTAIILAAFSCTNRANENENAPAVERNDSLVLTFINKYKPLIDTIKTPVSDVYMIDDLIITLYYNDKLIVRTSRYMLHALPKPFHDMILDIIGQAGGLYGFCAKGGA